MGWEWEWEWEFSSEALSFPAAGSLKRQLVSPKRGRAGNKWSSSSQQPLDTASIGIFTLTMDSQTKLH